MRVFGCALPFYVCLLAWRLFKYCCYLYLNCLTWADGKGGRRRLRPEGRQPGRRPGQASGACQTAPPPFAVRPG